MKPRVPQVRLYDDEGCIDGFAGGGGASVGIEWATGRSPDVAINHDAEALAMHAANHPKTRHVQTNIRSVDYGTLLTGKHCRFAWFSPDCFPAGTMVLARRGYVPIEEIEIGEEVLTHEQRWRRVTNTMSTERPLLQVRGLGHPGLFVSGEHPFLVKHRTSGAGMARRLSQAYWAPAKSLERGQYWASPTTFPGAAAPAVPVHRERELQVDFKLLWLAGRYVADGWTRLTDVRAELVLTCGRHEADDLRESLAQWPRAGTRSRSGELAWTERETGTAYQFSTSHRGLVEWLREHFGHGAAEKTIPGWLLGLSVESRQWFLDGYLSGDGCVAHGVGTPLTIATTVSKALAFGLKALVASLGHAAHVVLRTNQPDEIAGRRVNVRPAWSVKWRESITESHAHTAVEDGLLWAPIRERIHTGSELFTVYNLSVAQDESFVADGIIVHNCTYHSKARGGRPFRDRNRARRVRGLAWEMVRCVVELKKATGRPPDMLFMENVEEFRDWCPLGKDGRPNATKKGQSFRRWVARLKNLGGVVEHRELVADEHGAPTRRKRLFVIVRFDGQPIVWPKPTHGPKRQPYRTAAECIDFSLPVPSIFLTPREAKAWGKAHGVPAPKRPLASPTLRRVARGTWRFAINTKNPFIIPVTHQGDARCHSVDEPLRTITCSERGEFALVAPTLINTRNGERHGRHGEQAPRVLDIQAPYPTVTAQGSQGALVAAFLQKYHAPTSEGGERGQAIAEPIRTLDTSNRFGLVAAFLAKHNGGHEATGQKLQRPVDTIVCRENKALVTAFLVKYFGTNVSGRPLDAPVDTLTTKERFGLVTVTIAGEEYAIVDIGMRMLTPRELFRCQGFPSFKTEAEIQVWRDHATQAAGGRQTLASRDRAKSARGHISSEPQAHNVAPVVVNARIDCGQHVLVLRSPEKSPSSASSAAEGVSFPLPTDIGDFARMLAREHSLPVHARQTGRAAVRQSSLLSTHQSHGSGPAAPSSSETVAVAGDAWTGFAAVPDTQCTISADGQPSQSFASHWTTLCSFVLDAIGGSTLAPTSSASSLLIRLVVEHDYEIEHVVTVTDLGLPVPTKLSKKAQTRMCGNSVPPHVAAALLAANLGHRARKAA
jgi:site-specific DNA-cytosine methylase